MGGFAPFALEAVGFMKEVVLGMAVVVWGVVGVVGLTVVVALRGRRSFVGFIKLPMELLKKLLSSAALSLPSVLPNHCCRMAYAV